MHDRLHVGRTCGWMYSAGGFTTLFGCDEPSATGTDKENIPDGSKGKHSVSCHSG